MPESTRTRGNTEENPTGRKYRWEDRVWDGRMWKRREKPWAGGKYARLDVGPNGRDCRIIIIIITLGLMYV